MMPNQIQTTIRALISVCFSEITFYKDFVSLTHWGPLNSESFASIPHFLNRKEDFDHFIFAATLQGEKRQASQFRKFVKSPITSGAMMKERQLIGSRTIAIDLKLILTI